MPKKRYKLLILVAALLSVLCLAIPAGAAEIYTGGAVSLPEGKLIGPLFVSGNNVVINSDVDGDVFAAGENITVNGKIKGDLLAVGNQININGTVNGNARVAGANITVNGEITNSMTSAANQIMIAKGARVGRDLLAAVNNIALSGTVGRQLLGSGESIFINGPVDGSVQLWSVGKLSVGAEGAIAGNLVYGSSSQAEVMPGARIGGETTWNQVAPRRQPAHREGLNWLAQLSWFAAGVLVWGILTLIFPKMWYSLSKTITKSPLAGLGWGLLALLATPLAALLLLITVVGIPVSLALIMAYAAMLYAGKIIMGDAIGRLLSAKFGWEGKVPAIVPFMMGLAALILLTNIPIVGTIFNIAVTAMALGAVALALYSWRRKPPAPVINE